MSGTGVTSHLDLLKREHQTLVTKYNELLRSSTSTQNKNCLAVQLLIFVGELYKKDLLSDITLVVGEKKYQSHRFLLKARTDYWENISTLSSIEFLDTSSNVFDIVFLWLYTDVLSPDIRDTELLLVAEQACKYRFVGLKDTCEMCLRSRIDVSNVVSIFEFAENNKLISLSEHCSSFVAARWKDFKAAHFSGLSTNLLYRLLKGNSNNVLRSIIQLGREDALFLFFIDNEPKLSPLLNDASAEMCTLEEALSLGMIGIGNQLVQHGADVNLIYSSGIRSSILTRMIRQGNIEALRFLCEHNVMLDGVQDFDRNLTPLQLLCSSDLTEGLLQWTVEILPRLDLNFCPKAINGACRSALSLACLNPTANKLVKALLDSAADPDQCDSDGFFPLYHCLFTRRCFETAEQLILAGADVNLRVSNEPLLHLLVKEPNSFQFLLRHKPSLDALNSRGCSVLHCLILSYNDGEELVPELIKAVVEAGADINSCDSDGKTALHQAVLTSNRVVQVLSQFLSNYNWEERDNDGKTVLQLALEEKALDSAQALVDAGAPVNGSNGSSLLIELLLKGDDEGAVFLLRNKADIYVKDSDGRTPLEIAVTEGMIESSRSLCASGVDLNERTSTGYPVLERALANGHEECASLLIGYGCDLQSWTACEDGEQTLLHHLMDQGREEAAVFLINNGVDINAKKKFKNDSDDDGQTPLHMAVAWGLTETVKTLINHGADLNAQDKDERTAGHIAVRENNKDALTHLLSASDVSFIGMRDKLGQTPLSLAIGRKDHKSAAAIVARQPHAALQSNGNGENLLHVAVRSNDLESVLFLLGTHTDPTRTTQDQMRRTALHMAANIDDELIMRNLILAGCVVDARSADGSTTLHEAIRARKPNLVAILLDNNARTDILDEKGECAILTAVRAGTLECTKVLFDHNCLAGPVVNRSEQSALHICAALTSDRVEKGTTAAEICELVLNYQAQFMDDKELALFVDAKDKNGNTALLTAFMQGNAGVCRTLLKRGATMASKNNDGVTVFTYETPTKQLLFGLLDSLEREPRWSDGEFCDCGAKFSLTQRKHHCRHCGRQVCAPCSSISMPIAKFGEEKKVRVCSMCSIVLTEGGGRI